MEILVSHQVPKKNDTPRRLVVRNFQHHFKVVKILDVVFFPGVGEEGGGVSCLFLVAMMKSLSPRPQIWLMVWETFKKECST